ncbi:MAG: hypothetical protein JWL69_3371 [Phycisphaerales bacterium]|nr:hypothetical protein [Phycisphaerales bacterium]
MKFRAYPWLAALMAVALLPVCLLAKEPARSTTRPAGPATRNADDTQFLRFVDDKKGGGKLEAALVTYRNVDGVTVHLVSALHVGEHDYYKGLNDTFEKYDAVLYEMIKPKGAPPPEPGQTSHSAISSFQRFLKDTLALDFQLDDIDYSADNFVHADLDAETFLSMQKERGESILGIMLKSMMREMAKQAEGNGRNAPEIGLIDLLVAMKAPDRPRQLKLLLARQFNDIEDQMAGMDGPNGSVIITERNKKCMEVLKQTMAGGKNKDIGIFYGAGHMHDMEQRLEDMGFKKTAAEWRVGWDMTAPATPATRPATRPARPVAVPKEAAEQ